MHNVILFCLTYILCNIITIRSCKWGGDIDDGEGSNPKRNSSALSEPVNARDEVSFGYSNARQAMVASKAERGRGFHL